MKVKVIASGSKGNCTYVECDNIGFLIDVGINYSKIIKELNDECLKKIAFILITHTHSDHIKGLSTLLKKMKPNVYSSSEIIKALSDDIKYNNYHIVDKEICINGIEIILIPLSHDVECYGYLIKHNGRELVYITDTGYLNKRYFDLLSNKDIYIFESNHDEKMLMDGPYPYILKQRIVSDKGHLSNSYSGRVLSKIVGQKTKFVFLAHISEHNNDKTLLFSEVSKKLKEVNFDTDKIYLTDQSKSLETIEV